MATVKRFEDLTIFQAARELAKEIYSITSNNPFCTDVRFVQQIRASVGSIMDNIAEGFERSGNKEFTNFLYIAKGSAGELRSQLLRAHDVGFIDEGKYQTLNTKVISLSASITVFIKNLKNSGLQGSKWAH